MAFQGVLPRIVSRLGSTFSFAPLTLREGYRGCSTCQAIDRARGRQSGSFLTVCSEPFLCHKEALELAPSSSYWGPNICELLEKISLKHGMMGISAFTIKKKKEHVVDPHI